LREILAAYTPLLRHSPTLRLYGVTALRAVTFIGLLTYLGAFLADELDLGTRAAGFVYTAAGIGSAAASLLGGRIHFRAPRTVVGALILLNGVTTGIVLLSVSIWAAVPALMVTTGSSALAGVVIATLFVRESPAGTATTMVLNGTLLNVGAAVGAALGGVLIAVGGYTALGIGLPLFAFAAAALSWWPESH
jgi:predicted MFS family arabinose efflux permease